MLVLLLFCETHLIKQTIDVVLLEQVAFPCPETDLFRGASNASKHVKLPKHEQRKERKQKKSLYPKDALEVMMIPIMTPKRPNALPKISTTRILTNKVAF